MSDLEYTTLYHSIPQSSYAAQYTEHYGDAAIIPYTELQSPDAPHRHAYLQNRCLATALHRFLRIRQEKHDIHTQLMMRGTPVTLDLLQAFEETRRQQNIQPFPASPLSL